MLSPVIKMFLKSEINSQIGKALTLLTGELDNRDLKLNLNVKLSDIELVFAGTGKLQSSKDETLKTEHVNSWSYSENTGSGNAKSFLNNPDNASLEIDFSGKTSLSGIKFQKEFMGMGVKIKSVSFRFEITGTAEY